MPVLKVKTNGVWEEVDLVSGHTHNVDDIENFPTSLPASGGDADTLDGKHSDEFADSVHNHDDKYYTETEIDAKLSEKADSAHSHSISEVYGLEGALSDINASIDGKVSVSALENYYTKNEIDNLELITLEDIDAICGTTIQIASTSGVTF